MNFNITKWSFVSFALFNHVYYTVMKMYSPTSMGIIDTKSIMLYYY